VATCFRQNTNYPKKKKKEKKKMKGRAKSIYARLQDDKGSAASSSSAAGSSSMESVMETEVLEQNVLPLEADGHGNDVQHVSITTPMGKDLRGQRLAQLLAGGWDLLDVLSCEDIVGMANRWLFSRPPLSAGQQEHEPLEMLIVQCAVDKGKAVLGIAAKEPLDYIEPLSAAMPTLERYLNEGWQLRSATRHFNQAMMTLMSYGPLRATCYLTRPMGVTEQRFEYASFSLLASTRLSFAHSVWRPDMKRLFNDVIDVLEKGGIIEELNARGYRIMTSLLEDKAGGVDFEVIAVLRRPKRESEREKLTSLLCKEVMKVRTTKRGGRSQAVVTRDILPAIEELVQRGLCVSSLFQVCKPMNSARPRQFNFTVLILLYPPEHVVERLTQRQQQEPSAPPASYSSASASASRSNDVTQPLPWHAMCDVNKLRECGIALINTQTNKRFVCRALPDLPKKIEFLTEAERISVFRVNGQVVLNDSVILLI
jgi:hypothetical protein